MAFAMSMSLVLQVPLNAFAQDAPGAGEDDISSYQVTSDEDAWKLAEKYAAGDLPASSLTRTVLTSKTASIEESGYYALEEDVVLDHGISLDVDDKSVVILDLNGHSLSFKGDFDTAILLPNTDATFAIVDSGASKEDEASLTFAFSGASQEVESVSIIGQAKQDENLEAASDAQVSLLLGDIRAKVQLDSEETTLSASLAALHKAHAYLFETMGFSAFAGKKEISNAFVIDEDADDSITVLESVDVDDEVVVNAQNASAGSIVAHAYAKDENASKSDFAAIKLADSSLQCTLQDDFTYVASAVESPVAESAKEDVATQESADSAAEEESGQLTSSSSVPSAIPADGVDLSAAWDKAGTDTAYSITAGGTYYLGSDLSVSSTLTVNAPGKEVSIDLNDHALTSSNVNGVAIRIQAASKVTISGASQEKSVVSLSAQKTSYAIYSAADELVLDTVTVLCKANDEGISLSNLDVSAVHVSAGKLTAAGSAFTIDMSNQANSDVNGNSAVKGSPAAVMLDKKAGEASISNCVLNALNSQLVATSSTDDTVGYAYGVNSATSSKVTVSGTIINATSALGAVRGLSGSKIELTGAKTSFNLEATQESSALFATAEGGISIDSPVAVSYGQGATGNQLTLQSKTGNGFTFGSSCELESAAALIGSSAEVANDDGAVIGSFASDVSDDAKARIASGVIDARGEEGACDVAVSEDKLVFTLDEERAVAQIEKEDGTASKYATFAAAVAAVEDGQTIAVLRDNLDIAFSKSKAQGQSFTVDLAGHKGKSISYSGDSNLKITSSTGQASVSGLVSGRTAIVYSSGTGILELENLSISYASAVSEVDGVFNTSTAQLVLRDVDISVASARSAAYGIRASSTSAATMEIEGGSVEVRALTYGVGAYGIASSSRIDGSKISRCPITVEGTNATTRGLALGASFVLEGTEGEDTLTVSAAESSTAVMGIYAGGLKSDDTVELNTCTIRTGGASEGSQRWCLSTGTTDPTWMLEGKTLLQSCTGHEVKVAGNSIKFISGFETDSMIHIENTDTSIKTFASSEASVNASVVADYLAPTSDGTRASYTVGYNAIDDGSASYVWKSGAAIVNVTTQQSYDSINIALADASAGDELRLDSDVTYNGVLTFTKDVVVDINGKQLTLKAGTAAAAGTAGKSGVIAITDSASVRFADSVGEGALNLVVSTSVENVRMTYQGLAVSEKAKLTLDSLRVSVVYDGPDSASAVVLLRGVGVSEGTLSMTGASSLEVRAAAQDQTFGASDVKGIYASGSDAVVDLAETSSVAVANNASQLVQGTTDYPDYNGSSNAQSSSNAYLVELNLDKEGELYKEIAAKFLETATLDSNRETSSVYGANIYYANNMELDSGMHVWAYSKPVENNAIGKLASIVPEKIFVRSTYATTLYAYGIYGDDVSDANISAPASVSATTTNGQAYGAFGTDNAASWKLDEDKLTVSAQGESYLATVDNKFDLNDYLDLSASFQSQTITYPKSSSLRAVAYADCVAEKLASKVRTFDEERRGIEEDALYSTLYPAMSQEVSVTFANLHDATGATAQDETRTFDYGKTLSEAGVSRVSPVDYVVDGTTYRFVGWRMTTLSAGTAYSPDFVFNELVFDSSLNGVTSGKVTFIAYYVPVPEGERLISFESDNVICAYSVAKGEVPSYGAAYNSNAIVPSKLSTAYDYQTGYTYVFSGWMQEGEDARAVLPPVEGDQSYLAEYTQVLKKSSITARYRSLGSDGASIMTTGIITPFDWTTSASSALAKKVGDDVLINDHGTIYTLVGWSPRYTDVEALYTEDFYIKGSSSSFESSKAYYAVYEKTTQKVDVNFYQDGTLIGSVSQADATKTLATVIANAGIDITAISSSDPALQYRGWATQAGSDDYIEISLSTLYDVAGQNTTLDLHVIWRTRVFTVTFYDSDKTKIGSVGVSYGDTVKGSNSKFKVDGLDSSFAGWVYEDGSAFSIDKTKIYENTSVYAAYSKKSSSASTKKTSGSSGNKLGKVTGAGSAGLSLSGASDSLELAESSEAELDSKKVEAAAALSGNSDTSGGSGLSDAGEDGESAEGEAGLGGTIALAVAATLLLLITAFVIRWFVMRRAKDEELEEVPAFELERMQF